MVRHLASVASKLVPALCCALLVLPACDGEVTEEDLQKWTNNDIGLARIAQVIGDTQQPMTTRVRALEVVVEKGFATRVRSMIDEVTADRDELVKALTKELLDHIEKKDDHQYNAKDALMALQRYIAADDFDNIQQVVAKWAFGDITLDSPEEDVKRKIESRITSGQISDLGVYGYDGAGVLVSHGFVVDKMMDYLTGAEEPKATQLLIAGLRKHHATLGGVPFHHLEAIGRTESVDGLSYLLDIYLDTSYAKDIRTAAYNFASEMLDGPRLKKGANTDAVTKKLLQLMGTQNPLDRWQGALSIIHVDGVNRLEDVLAKFKDDKVYSPDDDPPPLREIMDLCLDIFDFGHAVKAVPVFMKHAQGDNRIVSAISIVCLKANQAQQAKPILQALAKPPGDPADKSLEDFLGAGFSVGQLAGNALDGLAMIAQATADEKAKKLSALEAKQKRQLITYVLNQRGEAYTAQVEKEFKEFQDDFKANPERYAEDQ